MTRKRIVTVARIVVDQKTITLLIVHWYQRGYDLVNDGDALSVGRQ